MLACISSIIVVRVLHGFSIYETRLLMQGIRIVRGHDANRLRSLKINNYICTDDANLPGETSLTEVMNQVLSNPFPHFMINDKQGNLIGVLTLRDIRAFLIQSGPVDPSITAADLMTRELTTVNENDNLEKAFHLFSNHHFSFLPVMSVSQPTFTVGYLKKDDLLTAYNQHVLSDYCLPSSNHSCSLPEKNR